MERTWDKKSIYHSHLVGYTREHSDGLVCMIEAGPMKSKFGDGEVAKIRVHGEPEGDDNGYWLKIENDDVADALSAIEAKQWVSLRAEGSREAATIVVDTVDGLSVTVEHDSVSTDTDIEVAFTPEELPLVKQATTEESFSSASADMIKCLLDARRVVEAYKEISGDDELTEDVRCLAQSLWINSH